MSRSRYKIVESQAPHFVTCTVLNWLPVFTRPETVNIILDSVRFLQAESFKLYGYVILENHLHLVAQSNDLATDMERFKKYTAKQCLNYLKQNRVNTLLEQLAYYKQSHKKDRIYQFWQEGYHPQWIQNQEMMHQKLDYIHQNPVKRGYVDLPEHWRCSSARDYQGQPGLLTIEKNG